MPSMYQVWSKWAPPFERTRMCGLQYAGHYIGIMMSMCTCGIIAETCGWEVVFYIYGGIACGWSIVWLALVRGSPENDYFISDEEKEYIAASLTDIQELPKEKSVPFKAILSSGPFWAIVVAHFAENWGLFTMLTQLPSFLKGNILIILGKSNHLLSFYIHFQNIMTTLLLTVVLWLQFHTLFLV